MAKKKKRDAHVSFLFDDDAGKAGETIDLFGPDEDAPSEQYAPEDAAPTGGFRAPEPFDRPEADGQPLPETTDEPVKPKKADKPSDTPKFRFDRYGRRIGKRAHYGKRKNAPKATTTVIEHETEAKREYDEARRRSEARAKRRAGEEAKAAELRKAERRKKRQRSASTFALGILAVAALAVLTWFTTRLNKVEIVNVPKGYTEERILALSGLQTSLEKGKSALFISTKKVEDRIREDPYLEATVRYAFPSKITITLSKRDEAACVRWGPQSEYLAIIDKNGTVLNDRAETTNGLLIADGMNISSAVNGSRLGDSSDIQVEALIRLLQKLNDRGLMEREPHISRIDMTELMRVRMYVEGMPYTIEVGGVALFDSCLDRLQRNWDEIMQNAAEEVRKGSMTVTIYLYNKEGPSVSKYEMGFAVPTQAPPSPKNSASPGSAPETTPGPEQGGQPSDGSYDPGPQPTPMPHQDDPYTG